MRAFVLGVDVCFPFLCRLRLVPSPSTPLSTVLRKLPESNLVNPLDCCLNSSPVFFRASSPYKVPHEVASVIPLFPRVLLPLFASLFLTSAEVRGQDNQTRSRITNPVEETQLTVIKGNVHNMARPMFDRGPAPPSLPMQRMLLVLQRSPEQENDLRKLLDEQQDKSSSNYHKWLTPEEFGQQFGASDQDLQVILSWLQSHGLRVDKITRGRTLIEFSGTAAQVQEAFHTEIHKFIVNGEEYWANSKDSEIPSALTPVVAGVATLHNFPKKPQIRIAEKRIPAHLQPGPSPQVTFQNGMHALGPGDYEVIYNMTSVIQGPPGVSGPAAGFGTTIAVVGRSNINVQDVARFRAIFNLPNNNPQIFVNGPDPGNLGGAEEAEAVLDTTWSGALAPGASVWLIVSASTNTTDGVDLSEVYIIDNSVGAIMTESFAGCEATITTTEAANISQLAEQAAAEGITYIVSAGDTGSAGCDNQGETQATGPFSVNALASTPFTVAVGGTEFNENGDNSLFWSSSNNQFTTASALSYIPEDVWNESCTIAQCSQQNANIAAGGGGASVYFSKPPWQSGVPGIPNDGMRDVPDVALAAAASHDPYLLCLDGSCQPDAQGNFSFVGVGGTSAAAPSFAGIVALVNSAVVPLNSHPRLGQINYMLYRLAGSQNASTCNGSSTSSPPATSCVFNDVTIGNNAVPGEVGYGTAAVKYQSGAGYDLASGLGSVNVANLISNWTKVAFSTTTTTLSLSPTTFTHGTSVTVNADVTTASGTPTGDVSLFRSGIGGTPSLPVQGNFFTLNGSGSVSSSTNLLPGGFYSVSAHYAGDGKFMPSDSSAITLSVSPEPSTTVASVLTLDQNGKFVSVTGAPYGSFVYLRADVTGQSGVAYATGSVNFTDNGANVVGNPYALNSQGNTVTPNGLFSFSLGQHSIVANYGGDPDFGASISPPVGFVITQASTSTALTFNSAAQGGTFSATVKTNSGGAPPSGTITFFIGGAQVGSPVPVTGIPAVVNPQTGAIQGAQATATLADTGLANGTYTISATYSGDSNYGGSSVVITVQPDYSLSASPNSITITSPGGPGSSTLTINAIDGFNGPVNFSCSNLPAMSSCQFSPVSVSGSGSTTLTITTTAPVALFIPNDRPNGVDWWSTSGEAAGIFFFVGVFWRRRWGKLPTLATFALLLTALGCGGGSSSPPPPPNPGTSPGTYTVAVTATSGSIIHNISLTLNVQ